MSPSTTTTAATHVYGALAPAADRLAHAITDRIFGTLMPTTPVPTAPPSGNTYSSPKTSSTEGKG